MMIPHLLSIGGSISFSEFEIPWNSSNSEGHYEGSNDRTIQTHCIYMLAWLLGAVHQIHHHNLVNYTICKVTEYILSLNVLHSLPFW